MRFARPLPHLLLALLVWGASAPLIAITCVPSAPCAGMGPCPLAEHAPSSGAPAFAAPNCCEQSTRDSGPPVLPGAKLQPVAQGDLAVTPIVSVPPAPLLAGYHAAIEPAAAAIPLYTLHSILLI